MGEMVQRVKCFLYRCYDMSVDPKNPYKFRSDGLPVFPDLRWQRQGILGARWLGWLVSSEFGEKTLTQ